MRSTVDGRHRHRTDPAAAAAGAVDGVRRDLQGLRAIAVIGVVVYHLRASWLPGGFAGVDVFFVLSGYFITGLLLREIDRTGSVDLLRFWGRRARRLLPASVLVIVVTVLAGYAMTNPLEAHRIGRDGLYASVFGMNWLSARQGTQYLQDPDPSPLVHYWSLGVEEQFYLVWPVLLLGLALLHRVARRHRNRPDRGPTLPSRLLAPRRTLFVVGALLGALSFLLALHQTLPANSYAYFGTFERVWQLALGGLLTVGTARQERLPGWLRVTWRYAGVLLIVAFYVAAGTGIVYPGRKALIPALGAALVLAAGSPRRHGRDPLTRLLGTRPAQSVGQYSYSWYLWHYPPIVLLPIYLGRPLRIRELGTVAVATVVLAALTYHLLENPVRANRWLAARRGGRSLALGALLIVVALGGSQLTQSAADRLANDSVVRTANGTVLSPQPAVADTVVVQPIRDDCQAPLTDTGLARECRYLPDTGHGDVVLAGDSHAGMWYPAVDAMARKNHWGLRVWARSSCPLADVTKQIDGHPYTVCTRWRADVLKRLVAAHPALVITGNYDSMLGPLYSPGTGKLVRGRASREVFEQGLQKVLAELRAHGIRTLVVADVPGYADAAPDCVLAHPHDLARCSAPQRTARPGAPDDLEAARAQQVPAVDFTSVFCHDGRCHQVVGATLAYRDVDHLTPQMVMRLEPRLNAAAVRAMRGSN